MKAARRFAQDLEAWGRLARTESLKIELYGSLALTGKGHGTDRAILLGLAGELPDQIDPNTVEPKLARIQEQRTLRLLGTHTVRLDPQRDLLFLHDQTLPLHSNAMRFHAYGMDGRELDSNVFYSVGGGFVVAEGELTNAETDSDVDIDIPFPFRNAAELLSLGRLHQKPIWEMVIENEKSGQSGEAVEHGIHRIWNVMKECTYRGLRTDGVLSGGLNVRRRAPRLYQALLERGGSDPLAVVDWINLFAIAVNEENAAGGRVVTAPTNGAAGVIPAVAHYYSKFIDHADDAGILRFFLTAGAIGILCKRNASISGAEVGCQGEVGVACSMAAGGLVAALDGTNEQVEHAAEIGMEHHLGMTCDPVGGLVQIPCIERNAFGAVKAVNAARMAMNETGVHKVSLDQVIRTMYETGKDMRRRYKETSLAGLAVNVINC
jgi:L-serine dehydratase